MVETQRDASVSEAGRSASAVLSSIPTKEGLHIGGCEVAGWRGLFRDLQTRIASFQYHSSLLRQWLGAMRTLCMCVCVGVCV